MLPETRRCPRNAPRYPRNAPRYPRNAPRCPARSRPGRIRRAASLELSDAVGWRQGVLVDTARGPLPGVSPWVHLAPRRAPKGRKIRAQGNALGGARSGPRAAHMGTRCRPIGPACPPDRARVRLTWGPGAARLGPRARPIGPGCGSHADRVPPGWAHVPARSGPRAAHMRTGCRPIGPMCK